VNHTHLGIEDEETSKRRKENHMFEGKGIIKRKINISVLVIILLGSCSQVLAQQHDFIREDNLGKFLNELLDIDFVTDISKDFSLFEIPPVVTVDNPVDIQKPPQETKPGILLTAFSINLTDYDLHQWTSTILGSHKPHTEKSSIPDVSTLSNSNKLLEVKGPKFNDFRLVEAILASQQGVPGENPLLGLAWQINERIDFAIVGQYCLDMTYPDLVNYLKNKGESQSALYAKLTLRF
jgi:hypothetical protein